ncbi:hypothetical protein CF66_7023 [Candidatus Photodesmus katoptron]|uniref:YggT family protein n=1 Tax=Candidatus Photodesmus katoptron Akat1 TaxID=1236703 RepID=S3DJE2_9GAMM|nr:YggT family protein [Candidatus Photodesmus katoptron]EPE37259.1 hypothetical protein O1U_0559 [Candidatus Photodesmus katoptron Akat1]KEY90084.1 hypothetical protein CF66_7023 [Candidatus Photodesmus katoptron]
MNSMSFLTSTLFDLYIMVIILRIWLQASHADFYNPFSQFIVKSTQPVVGKLQKIIPFMIGNIDITTTLFAYLLCVLKLMILTIISSSTIHFSSTLLLLGIALFIKTAGSLLFWILLICTILSWVNKNHGPIEHVFYQLTEPMLMPIRRIIPIIGGFDLSVLALFIGLQFANFFMGDIIGPIWYRL